MVKTAARKLPSCGTPLHHYPDPKSEQAAIRGVGRHPLQGLGFRLNCTGSSEELGRRLLEISSVIKLLSSCKSAGLIAPKIFAKGCGSAVSFPTIKSYHYVWLSDR